jgi:hypothetical protein
MVQDAVLRRMETLADAAARLSSELRDRHPEIPWRLISDFRNVLAHAYTDVRLEVVWQVIVRDLPPLARVVSEEIPGIFRTRPSEAKARYVCFVYFGSLPNLTRCWRCSSSSNAAGRSVTAHRMTTALTACSTGSRPSQRLKQLGRGEREAGNHLVEVGAIGTAEHPWFLAVAGFAPGSLILSASASLLASDSALLDSAGSHLSVLDIARPAD